MGRKGCAAPPRKKPRAASATAKFVKVKGDNGLYQTLADQKTVFDFLVWIQQRGPRALAVVRVPELRFFTAEGRRLCQWHERLAEIEEGGTRAQPWYVDYDEPPEVSGPSHVASIAEKLRGTQCKAADLVQLKSRLDLPESVHAEPTGGTPFVPREDEAREFRAIVKEMHDTLQKHKQLIKQNSPLLEYSTMSGAGKTRWGFEVERLLKQGDFKANVSRVGLNFNGGSGGGSADRTTAEAWRDDHQMGIETIMSALLLARGLLRCSPDLLRGAEDWLRGLTPKEVIDAIFLQMHCAEGEQPKILIVHVDELARLWIPKPIADQIAQPEAPHGSDDGLATWSRTLKDFVNILADYNCSGEARGLVVPVITHTAPVAWNPVPTEIPLQAQTLRPMTSEQSEKFFDKGKLGFDPAEKLESCRLISACGGHPTLLVELADKMAESATLSTVFALKAVRAHRDAMVANLKKSRCRQFVKIILQQTFVSAIDYLPAMQAGLVCLEFTEEQTRVNCRISLPYPMMVNMLLWVDPDRFKCLKPPPVPALDHKWSADAFEVLCALKLAAEFNDELPFEGRPCMTILDMAKRFKNDGKKSVSYWCPENQEGLDSVGFHNDRMTVIQSKYSAKAGVDQKVGEVQDFIKFVMNHAVGWARTAGCNELHGIFATDRGAPDFSACGVPPVQPDDVVVTFTMYADNENEPKLGGIRSQLITDWLPRGVLCV